MRIYLEPAAWSTTIEKAPCGFLVRIRKGKPELFLKTNLNRSFFNEEVYSSAPAVFNESGTLTTVTGQVFPIKIKAENVQDKKV